jgi:predicted transposase/invertase (TIGR01784 family)
MKTLLSKNPNLQKAYDAYERCTQDRQLREIALARERFLHDQASRIGTARRQGIAEGLERGAWETARRVVTAGVDAETIASFTQLPVDSIRDIEGSGGDD